MQLSFIIPAYNEEKYLPGCLDSIFREIARNPRLEAEVLVVNNASTDETKKVAQNYKNVRVIDEPKKGLVFARAAGAKAAQGELQAHIDADCLLPSGWIQRVLKGFDSKNIIALSGPYHYMGSSKAALLGVKIYYIFVFLVHFLSHLFRMGAVLQGGNFVVKRKAWEKIGSTSTDFSFYGEDAELGRRLNKIGKIKFDLRLTSYTSSRRLEGEGIFKTAFRYFINYLSVIFLKKPFTKKYSDIRGT